MRAHFLVPAGQLSGPRAVLTGSELHHLRVRRLHIGSAIVLGDGQGRQRHGRIVALDARQAVVDLSPELAPTSESPLRLVLAQAALKADKMDLIVEKATELGVTEIVVYTSERSLGHPSPARQARWQRIARSATKQSQRSVVPAIVASLAFDALLTRSEDLRILFCARGATSSIADVRGAPQSVLAVIGPEGGFGDSEMARAAARGFHMLGLGPRTLRAETASLAAIALCQLLWGDLGHIPA